MNQICTIHHGEYMSWLEDNTGFRLHYILAGSRESRALGLKSYARKMHLTILTEKEDSDDGEG